jgi:hypothetical protein
MKHVSDMYDPEEVQERIDYICCRHPDAFEAAKKIGEGDEIPEIDLENDGPLFRVYEAMRRLRVIRAEIAAGMRCENGDVNVRV